MKEDHNWGEGERKTDSFDYNHMDCTVDMDCMDWKGEELEELVGSKYY